MSRPATGPLVRAAHSMLAGLAGTTVMTLTTRLEAEVRGSLGPIDYDDSRVPVRLLERLPFVEVDDEVAEARTNQVLRFGYGSAAGLVRGGLDGRTRHPAAAFFALTWGAEVVALPALGAAPAVWRWRRDVLATSLVQHAVYAWVTDATYRWLEDPSRRDGPGVERRRDSPTDRRP